METFIGILFIIVCLLLIVVVLLQKGRGGGLGAAFGGAGSSAFGTRTGDVFTWVTIVLTGLFLLLAIGATILYRPATGTVLTPKLAPDKGPISNMKVVQITCQTGNARIAYTTDGSEPTEGKAKSGGIVGARVRPGQTLKVRAYRKKWKPSALVVVTYEKKEPAASKPAASKPAASRPAASKPAASKPAASKPAASKPAASKPAPPGGGGSGAKPAAGQ